ncbi:MAG: hypothetical protein ACR2JI_04785 [Mycobacterium sp.]
MQTPLETWTQVSPGCGGVMVGEKELGPPAAFSVGVSAGALVAGADVGVVFGSSLVLLQPAVSAPIATIADPPITSVT